MDSSSNKIKIQTGIGPMTDKLLANLIDKLNENKDKIYINAINPIIRDIKARIVPYAYVGFLMYIILIILLLFIIYILMIKKHT